MGKPMPLAELRDDELRGRDLTMAHERTPPDVILSNPIVANPPDTPIEAPAAMRPDSPAAPNVERKLSGYVWCDNLCEVHPKSLGGEDKCSKPEHHRPVYVRELPSSEDVGRSGRLH